METIEEELNELLDKEISKGKTFNLHDYLIEERIYFGNFSEISIVENKKTKEKYALKSFLKEKIHELNKEKKSFKHNIILRNNKR